MLNLKGKVKARLYQLKEWAWSIPSCDSEFCNKLDASIDKGLANIFDNKTTRVIGEKIQTTIEKICSWQNPEALKKYDTTKKD